MHGRPTRRKRLNTTDSEIRRQVIMIFDSGFDGGNVSQMPSSLSAYENAAARTHVGVIRRHHMTNMATQVTANTPDTGSSVPALASGPQAFPKQATVDPLTITTPAGFIAQRFRRKPKLTFSSNTRGYLALSRDNSRSESVQLTYAASDDTTSAISSSLDLGIRSSGRS